MDRPNIPGRLGNQPPAQVFRRPVIGQGLKTSSIPRILPTMIQRTLPSAAPRDNMPPAPRDRSSNPAPASQMVFSVSTSYGPIRRALLIHGGMQEDVPFATEGRSFVARLPAAEGLEIQVYLETDTHEGLFQTQAAAGNYTFELMEKAAPAPVADTAPPATPPKIPQPPAVVVPPAQAPARIFPVPSHSPERTDNMTPTPTVPKPPPQPKRPLSTWPIVLGVLGLTAAGVVVIWKAPR